RHQAAVLTAAVLFGLAALVLGASTAWVGWANRQKDEALAERDKALAGEKEKGEQLRIKSEEAEKNLGEARKNLTAAATNLETVSNGLEVFQRTGSRLRDAGRMQDAAYWYGQALDILDRIDATFPLLLGADKVSRMNESTRKQLRAFCYIE